MFCQNCGAQLPDRAQFCARCGMRFGNSPSPDPRVQQGNPPHNGGNQQAAYQQHGRPVKTAPIDPRAQQAQQFVQGKQSLTPKKAKKAKKKKGTKLRVALLCTSFVLIGVAGAGGYLFYQYYNSPEQVILRDLTSGDFAEAARVYNRNFDDKDDAPEDVWQTVVVILDDSYTAFINGEKSYSAICHDIEVIGRMEMPELEDKLSELQVNVDALNASWTAFETGNQYLDEGNYEAAIAEYQNVIADDANYTAAQDNLELAITSYRDAVLAQAKELADAGDLDGAVTVLESGLLVLENDSQITQQLSQYETQITEDTKQEALDTAQAAASDGDYVSALKTLTAALKKFPGDSDLQTRYDQYEAAYVKAVIAAADDLIDKNDYDGAITQLTQASNFLSDNQELAEKLAAVEGNRPVELRDLKSQNADNFCFIDNSVEDVQGNLYAGENIMLKESGWNGWQGTGFVEFYCGGDYSTLSFTLVPETSFASNHAITIEILTDGNSKKAIKVTQKMEPTLIQVDITGCQWLQIKASGINGTNDDYTTCIISNPVVQK